MDIVNTEDVKTNLNQIASKYLTLPSKSHQSQEQFTLIHSQTRIQKLLDRASAQFDQNDFENCLQDIDAIKQICEQDDFDISSDTYLLEGKALFCLLKDPCSPL